MGCLGPRTCRFRKRARATVNVEPTAARRQIHLRESFLTPRAIFHDYGPRPCALPFRKLGASAQGSQPPVCDLFQAQTSASVTHTRLFPGRSDGLELRLPLNLYCRAETFTQFKSKQLRSNLGTNVTVNADISVY